MQYARYGLDAAEEATLQMEQIVNLKGEVKLIHEDALPLVCDAVYVYQALNEMQRVFVVDVLRDSSTHGSVWP